VQGDWQIVNGMMRMGKNVKKSVIKKQATRLRRKDSVQVVVSRVSPQSARFEVVMLATSSNSSIAAQVQEQPKLTPAFLLQPKQELVGNVTRIVPYGVFVDVGANRRGLLHIQKVADLYGRYIDKEQGLEEAGLERGARIRVAVLSNEKKRLFLDFTDDVKQDAEAERTQEETVATKSQQQEPSDGSSDEDSFDISEEEAAAWAAYASTGDESEGESTDNDYDYQDDDYDEERDIEDALGLGTY
jgi:predicted RNA-binding protein with RPS1 domain